MVSSIRLKIEQTIQRWRDEDSHILIVKPIYYLRSIYNSTMGLLFFNSIVSRIRNTGPVADLDILFNLASRGWYGIIAPIQSRNEFISLLNIISDLKPVRLLEIGTASGGTLFMFTRVASNNATIVSVDLPGGAFGGGYPPGRIPLYSAFALPNQNLNLIRADSHSAETFELVKQSFGNEPIDFIFIDGDHTYEGVRSDFEMYKKLIRGGGYIAFHDTEYAEGVSQFWSEIKNRYEKKWEFIAHKGPRYGIGLLQIEKNT